MIKVNRIFIGLLAFCMLAASGLSQGLQRTTVALANAGNYARVLANAQVTVCQYNVVAPNVCTAPVTVYEDFALTIPYSPAGKLRADTNGNYNYYAPPGNYFEQVCATGAQCITRPISLSSPTATVDWTHPGAIGSASPNTAAFTTAIVGSDPYVDPRASAYMASCSNNAAIDDSTAISSALVAAQIAGEEVQITGTCWVQHPIVWPSAALSSNLGFGLRGTATGGTIKAATNFPNTGPESALILRTYSSTGPAQMVTLRDITLDANSTAASCVTFEAQRLLFLDKVTCLSATGNGGGEMNFGRAAGGSGLVGLTARDIEIDNGAIVAAQGAGARPSYGLYLNNNATDGDISNVNVNQNAIAGIYVNSGPNKFASLHPWGFSSLQGGTWPQYGIYLDTHAFGNSFVNTQCDTTQSGCFFASKGFFSAVNTVLECNDGGTGSLCATYLAVAATNASRIFLFGGRFQGGSIVPTGSPINWQGSVDTSSQWFVEWPTQQWGIGTSNMLTINPILNEPSIFQPSITGVLNVPGGTIHVSGAGNSAVLVQSTSASSFPAFVLQNGTNEWFMQLGSTTGNWSLQDQSTSNLVIQVAEGSPANAINIGTSNVSIGEQLDVTGSFVATGNVQASGTGNRQLGAITTDVAGFPEFLLQNGTNAWQIQVNGSAGSFSWKDSSTGNLVLSLSEGAPAGSLVISSAGVVSAHALTVGSATLMSSSVALTNGAGSSTATLTNAPAATNPTKWIPINDNGTTRFIPAW